MRFSALVLLVWAAAQCALAQAPDTFTNPIRDSGPDPWVEYRDGSYYLMTTTGGNLTIWKAATLSGLKTAQPNVV